MTSRDGSNRYRQQPAPRATKPGSTGQFGLDADELDRYMSGQPAKQPRFDPYGRSQSTGRTQAARPVQEPRYQAPANESYQDWDDQGYEDEFEDYADYQPEPVRQPVRQSGAQRRQPVQDYDDDLYDDPYVLDEDEVEERPQRRSPRSRAASASAGFTLPAFITNAPILKDRTSLMMLGAGFLGVILMIIVVAMKRSGLDASIPTHINALGAAQVTETSNAIWRMPLIAGMVMMISSAIAWFLARWGEFLPRFLLGGSLGVQFIVWVAVIGFLF